jgi:hypothetical protein
MKTYKILITALFITFSSLVNVAYAKTLNFNASTYVGEVEKGKAHGVGIFTFTDGSTYEGQVKKNKMHGKGKYIDSKGIIYEGKFSYGKITKKINGKTRKVIKLNNLTGPLKYFEKKGEGALSSKWFEAESKIVNKKKIKLKTVDDLDIFDLPSVFSSEYRNEEKILEVLNSYNEKILAENILTAKNPKNLETVIEYTSKGKKDIRREEATSYKGQDDINVSSSSSSSGC